MNNSFQTLVFTFYVSPQIKIKKKLAKSFPEAFLLFLAGSSFELLSIKTKQTLVNGVQIFLEQYSNMDLATDEDGTELYSFRGW